MITYYEWDYDRKVVTQYERSGACKQCGACCRAHIAFTHTNPPRARDPKKGGASTCGHGVWQELNTGRWRYFYSIYTKDGENVCGGLQDDNRCADHDDPKRSMICRVWPLSPTCLLPKCGWSFKEVYHWPIDEIT